MKSVLSKLFRDRYRRPSWVVVTTASNRDITRVVGAARHLRSAVGRGVVALYEPAAGEQGITVREIARDLSALRAGRHYALTIANVADDPDYGGDDGEAFESGKHVGSLKASPAALLTYFGVRVPGIAPSEPDDGVLELWPLPPEPVAGEPKVLGAPVRQWHYLLQRYSLADLSYFIERSEREVLRELAPLLASPDATSRLVAATLLSFSNAEAVSALREAISRESDEQVLAALRETEQSLSDPDNEPARHRD